MVGSLPAFAFFQLLMKTELKGVKDVDRPREIIMVERQRERTQGAEKRMGVRERGGGERENKDPQRK